MPRKNILEDIINLSSFDIENLSKESLETLVSKGSKAINQRIRRLKTNEDLSKISTYLEKNKSNSTIKERKLQQAKKLTKTELKKELRKIKNVSMAKTTSVSGVKKYIKNIYERTGVDIRTLSASDWSRIRKRIELGREDIYTSDDIIESYEETYFLNDEEKEWEALAQKINEEKYDDLSEELDASSPFDFD